MDKQNIIDELKAKKKTLLNAVKEIDEKIAVLDNLEIKTQ